MHFQYQYSGSDLRVIREADDRVYFSPGTTVTVWAIGIAACMLMLGICGAWSMLSWFGIFAAFFTAFYVYVVTRRGHGQRETLVRYMTVNETGLVERYLNSEFHRSWSSIQKGYETDDHFLFHHFSSVIAIPKRAVPVEQFEEMRNVLDQRIKEEPEGIELDEFSAWLGGDQHQKVHWFTWAEQDLAKIYESPMTPFDPIHSKANPPKKISKRWIGYSTIYLGLVVIAFSIEPLNEANHIWKRILMPLALAIPFLVGRMWWRHTNKVARETAFKFPPDEIGVAITTEHLVVGFPTAMSRYGWEDIRSFVFNQSFVGFVPQNGMIHLISNRAFGGMENALDFLRSADRFREQSVDDSSRKSNRQAAAETGNPYQTPQ